MRALLILPLVNVLVVVFYAKPVKAESGTIYIRADGSIEPSTASISTIDNVTYTFTGNIYGSIVVERNNTVIDGAGYTVQGEGPVDSEGTDLTKISNVTIKNMNITAFYSAISLYSSSNISLDGNNMANNSYGVYLSDCSNISISANSMTQNSNYDIMLYNSSYNDISNNKAKSPNEACIFLDYSFRNIISNNDLTSYGVSIRLWFSSDNNTLTENNLRGDAYGIECESDSSNDSIYHNNFIGNANYASTGGCINVWDGGYPAGGNYWSNYTGFDVKSGPYQNETGSDGIGDTPYTIVANNTDDYPLMGTLYSFTILAFPPESNMSLTIISNSSVTNPFFIYAHPPFWSLEGPELPLLVFSVNGGSGAVCFCRLIVPKAFFLDSSTYIVFVDSQPINATVLTPTLNSTQAYLYFTCTNSTHQVIVTVPEFSLTLILPLFMTTTLLTVIIYKEKDVKTSES